MEFTAILREVGGSLLITVPNEIVKFLNLKEGDIKQFNIINTEKVTKNEDLGLNAK